MRYLSLCDGIGAAHVSFQKLGWKNVGISEIDPYCELVINHHYPTFHNYGSITNIRKHFDKKVDLIIAGTPCQDFSQAGKREGLDGQNAYVFLEFLQILEEIRPKYVVWENVPNVRSAEDGRALGLFFGWLSRIGYWYSYRTLYLPHFGIPQKRKRLFVVASSSRKRLDPARLLFGREVDSTTFEKIETYKTRLRNQRVQPLFPSKIEENEEASEIVRNADYTAPRLFGTITTQRQYIYLTPTLVQNIVYDNVLKWFRYPTPVELERLQGFPDDYTNVEGVGYKNRQRMMANTIPIPFLDWISSRMEILLNAQTD
jgi:DNA-cytosine methyltransferase